jgi:hypothetical protein
MQRFAVQGASFFHDNSRPRYAAGTVEAIRQMKFDLLPHMPPPLSPIYSRPNSIGYHMFGPLMKPCADKDLPVIVKPGTRCIRGFEHNR